jgi:hypothetical protein
MIGRRPRNSKLAIWRSGHDLTASPTISVASSGLGKRTRLPAHIRRALQTGGRNPPNAE